MPGFWYEETENKVDNKFDEIHEISSFLKLNENMGNKKSILIFNKVPLEKALNKNDVEKWINNATIKADIISISFYCCIICILFCPIVDSLLYINMQKLSTFPRPTLPLNW